MTATRVAHTADLSAAELAGIRALLDDAFAGDVDETDVEHLLGGMHVLVRDGERLVAHGAVVMRRLHHGGRALRTGYVEAVAVASDRRRTGLGAAVMDELERIVRGGYELGALGASDDGAALYTARGWRRWRGPTAVLGPCGTERTPDEDGNVHVLPVAVELDETGELACDWRAGAVW